MSYSNFGKLKKFFNCVFQDLLEVCKRESIKKDHLSTPSSHFFDYLNTNVDQTGKEPGTAEVTACQADSSTGPSPEKATELWQYIEGCILPYGDMEHHVLKH